MNALEIIKLTAIYLQMEEVLELDIFGGSVTEQTEAVAKDVELLTRCLNLIYDEIATDYLPLLHSESLSITNNRIAITDLEKRLINIMSLKDINDKTAKYKLYPTYIELNDGSYTITYSYIPNSITINDTLEDFGSKLTERILAYGVASEFALISGLYDEASLWEKRFKDAMLIASRVKSEVIMPKRRWF